MDNLTDRIVFYFLWVFNFRISLQNTRNRYNTR